MRIKEFCNGKLRDFAMVLRARKVSGAFEKQAADRTSNLHGALTRFRQEKYAFMADIGKMFFRVRVRRED